MENWGRGVVTDLVRGLRSNWETPSFMSGRARFRENDPVSHAEARLFFGFWSGRSRLVEDTFQELLRSRLLRPHHVSDTVFSLLELGQPEDASRVLEQVDRETPGDTPRDSRLEELCRAAVVGALGRLDEAFELIARSPLDPGDRASNSARLWVARALIDHEETSRAFTVLRPLGPRDSFAREQLAWFHLQQLDLRRAERHLKPFRERGDHRTGRNLSNFLEGASLMLRSRAEEAMEVFGCLPETRWPRTWTLGSHLATGRLGEGSPEVYLENAFPWERTTLASHQALLDRVRG